MPRIRFASIRRMVLGACALAASAAPTVHAQTCTPFSDVAAADGFCSSIQWMHNRGITLGCTSDQYCPAQFVRRDQMAAFMFRLGNVVHQQGGSAFGGPAVIGSTDAHPVDIRANNARVMRYEPNAISPNVLGGSPANSIAPGVRGATIAGGGVPAGNTDPDLPNEAPNRVTDVYGTIGGGYANLAGDDAGTLADSALATVGGGYRNRAGGLASTIAGGSNNMSTGAVSIVAGGEANSATGDAGTVAGGLNNTASGTFSSSPGGRENVALGDYSFAAGRRAKANSAGCFVWADSNDEDFTCATSNAFIVRATGGVVIRTGLAPPTHVILTPGSTAWAPGSDRNSKENIEPVDPRDVLDRLVEVPIATWNLKSQSTSIRHMGPMAQDIHAAFGLGESDRHISTIDADGIALAAIQGLNAKLEAAIRERDAVLASQSRELALLRHRLDALLARPGPAAEAQR